jgi:hypothetical protein
MNAAQPPQPGRRGQSSTSSGVVDMSTHGASRGITRREALRHGLMGAAALALLGRGPARAAVAPAKAKAVIQLWMWGGPCHLDTFDPKPDAGNDYTGPFTKPLETNVPGIRINELLPTLAQEADKYSIIRGMTHGVNAHETASYIVQTGRKPGVGVVFPCVGAMVSLLDLYDHGYAGQVPPYIVLTEPQGRFSESGFLGPRYKPFATGGDPNQKVFAVEGIVSEGVTTKRQSTRRELLHTLDSLGRAVPNNATFAAMDSCEDKAYDMILGDGGNVFDLSHEPDDVREAYGRNTFGQSCLVARRLVEQGVPYVTINFKTWDTHKRHFEAMRRMLPELDRGMGTLLADLTQRGLLDSTIVWWGGEFGRTPKIEWEEPWNGGRGHYGQAFCHVVAGGGLKGGRVVGATDERGETVIERPVSPQELIRSMYILLGIDPDAAMPHSPGIDTTVMPMPEGSPVGGGCLAEIM